MYLAKTFYVTVFLAFAMENIALLVSMLVCLTKRGLRIRKLITGSSEDRNVSISDEELVVLKAIFGVKEVHEDFAEKLSILCMGALFYVRGFFDETGNPEK